MRRPDDFHLHLRQGPAMAEWARASALHFSRALVMPNTLPPIDNPERLLAYKAEIEEAAGDIPSGGRFVPLMAFKIMPGMEEKAVEALKEAGCVAGKYYPAGATTNSQDGLAGPDSAREALTAMEALGIPLSIHAELPEAFVLERETAFLPVIENICRQYPKLKIVIEHLSCASTVEFVKSLPSRVGASITTHHLLFSLDDLMGESLNPHLFCKPVVKTPKDRQALADAVLSGNPRFFFGSDSAPHPRAKKEGPSAPGGIFSAPVALPLLAEIFDRAGKLPLLENFASGFGAQFYGLAPNSGRLRIVKRPWRAPDEIAGAVTLMAGKQLAFTIETGAEK
jgi:dihydroorotase